MARMRTSCRKSVSGPTLFPDLEVGKNGRIKRDRLPTNTTTYRHPIHRWFNFIAGFSPEFVHACSNGVSDQSDSLLLDPFAGCATAPLVACSRGMRSIGYEPHPIFARIARAKLPGPGSLRRLDHIAKAIAQGLRRPRSIDILSDKPRAFLTKLFPDTILETLLGAREVLREENLMQDDLAFLILSKIVDLCSHSQTDGVYKAPTSRKTAISPQTACDDVIGMVRCDLETLERSYRQLAYIYKSSSEDMHQVADSSVSLVVTSPPYLNNFDYAEMTRMHLYFWEIATSWGEITQKVRSKLIVNTTTALKGHKDKQVEYRTNVPSPLHAELDDLVAGLAEKRQTKAGKKEYDYLVYPYFSQMTNVLRECLRCMKPGAAIHIMVADAALYGIHVSTPQILCDLLQLVGFESCKCSFVRKRGHRWILSKREGSPIGLGEYHLEGIK